MYTLLGWWDRQDLNSRPSGYEPPALTNWATIPYYQSNSCNYSTGNLPYKTLLHLYHIDEEGITAMHISYILPLSGWYLAQAQPDLTAKNPTHTRLEQRKVVETSSSAWKADVLAVVRPLHKSPAYKALLHHHWRAGNNSGSQRRSTKRYATILWPWCG